MRKEKPVFEVLLTEDNYDKNIKYTDDFTWSDSDKKNIQSFIWNRVLNLTDLKGEVPMDTAHGKLLIRFKANQGYPPDSPKRRLKQVEGFLLQEVPDTTEVQSTQEPEIKETQESTTTPPLTQENVSSSIELKHYRIILKNGVREEFDASRYEERNEQYQFYKEDAKIAFVLVSSVALMRWS